MILLFDAANTIIEKPALLPAIGRVLLRYGYKIESANLAYTHKLVSELYLFPDRTDKAFYHTFNRELMFALGIVPTDEMLTEIFTECSYLPWKRFDDTKYLYDIKLSKSILSNFHNGLLSIIDAEFPDLFTQLTVSEHEKVRKPDPEFFLRAIERSGVKPSEIIYVGDSVKLDLEPALAVGMNAWLIDRHDFYPLCKRRIRSLSELEKLL